MVTNRSRGRRRGIRIAAARSKSTDCCTYFRGESLAVFMFLVQAS
jgi:hypothetical protein